ncbi:SsgA family sporulation/cell division regulator [Streptomyces alkaliterrae]|uniref:SsgA family sporulation/cell division regulator n=1 Tax=Streptomyces alkaliterrae TaxID=2213162 RepID=A0A5P0YZE6_9ACTN|nr:SsgA family sporulation/cell division regulator [Streptomyces alkaliterrae]MBB1252449.1 SsgA family sporulation/cell division regulator [Streptomyces alkaliterrae]MBB1261765.1 SsgA family sporulation/cell division regulator [Streptomyces alkaliterrae]MQS03889.1 SsgA family sporulation/cell division regulator [Streptomyces alkaliterrae]
MGETVQAHVMMSFLASEELAFRIPVELVYEAQDPYAVRFTFCLPGDAPVSWVFGRELLVDGITGQAGEGDVHIGPVDDEYLADLHIQLHAGAERAVFRVSAPPLVAFLDRTDRIVPLGHESAENDIDAELDRILTGGRA